MSWARILEIDFGPNQPLRQRIDKLFNQQRHTWPTFRDGEAALGHLPTKTLTHDGDTVVVQLNRARRSSVLAKTDAQSIAARACFLCPENMPPEERGVTFGDLVVLPNPFPCLPMHATIASREHVPQRIAGRIASFLHLAQELGPDLAVTYNGPQCGASVPDHFHFQCVRTNGLPIFNQMPASSSRTAIATHSNLGRPMFVITGANVAQVQADITQTVGVVGENLCPGDEPMVNIAGLFDGEHFTVLLFSRKRHRPACYFAAAPERLIVSPGALEMCGLFVVTDPTDFERINATVVSAIFDEVCAPHAR